MLQILQQTIWVITLSSCGLGFFLALVFLRQKQKDPQTNLVLSILLIVLACSVGANAIFDSILPIYFPFLHTLPEPFFLLIGPLFYEYILSLSGAKRSFSKGLVHILPFGLVAIGLVFVMTAAASIESYLLVRIVSATWFGIYIHFWVYFFLNRHHLRMYKTGLKATHSVMEGVYHSWINYCLNLLLICYSVLGIIFFLQHGHIELPFSLPINRSFALILAVMIYCMGYWILLKPTLFSQAPRGTDAMDPEVHSVKYKKSGLRNQVATDERAKIVDFMQNEKPYVDPELNLKRLAEMLQLSPHHLSQIINTELETSFYDFVNGYRVNEAKRLLLDKAKNHLTLIHLAFDAGFNSKATFNRMFKKITTQTPSQYRHKYSRD